MLRKVCDLANTGNPFFRWIRATRNRVPRKSARYNIIKPENGVVAKHAVATCRRRPSQEQDHTRYATTHHDLDDDDPRRTRETRASALFIIQELPQAHDGTRSRITLNTMRARCSTFDGGADKLERRAASGSGSQMALMVDGPHLPESPQVLGAFAEAPCCAVCVSQWMFWRVCAR